MMEVTNEQVDVVAAPVLDGGESTWVSLIICLVGHGETCDGIRIEIVIHMNAIHIVVLEDVLYHHAGVGAVLWDGRIEDIQSVVLEYTFWVTCGGVIGSQFFGELGLGTIGVNPRMALHLALVALLHHPCQGVPPVSRSHALCAGEVA